MEGRTAHATVQAVGMTMLAVMAVTYVVLSIFLFDAGDELGAAVGIVAALVALTVAVWWFDNVWVRVLGVLASLAFVGSTFFMAFGIFQPFSPLEFVLGLLLVAGFVLSVVWGLMAVVAGFRDRSGPTGVDRAVTVWVPVVVGVLSVVSVVGFLVTRQSVSAEEAADATRVEMTDFAFEPGTVTVAEDGKLLVTNEDPAAHDFTLEALDLYAYVGPGSEVVVDLEGVAPGTYDYVCSLHVDPSTGEGMTGQLTISG